MIEVKQLNKSFGAKAVLNNINSVFQDGKTSLIIGTSGSGKTVFMRCMVGLVGVDSGDIIFDGKSILAGGDVLSDIRRNIGMLFQGGALFDSLTVEQNVMFPLNMFTNQTIKEKLFRVNFCLERVNMAGTNQLYPNEISGGMKKRVGIARAIVNNPKYLFCDEPNSGLDPLTSIRIDELIAEITRDFKMTTIINTHDMNSVMSMGEHIIFLYQGEKKWEGNNKMLYNTQSPELERFIFASEWMKELRQLKISE